MRYLATSTMQVVCAIALALASARVAAQSPQAPSQQRPSSRAALSRQLAESLTTVLRWAADDRAFPGAYAVVGDSRGVLAELGVGRLDWAASPRPNRHTIWDLASLTKVIATTTAAAQLVERGKIVLDAPVQRYLPEWVGPGKDSVTVRHLLTHTSGLPAFRNYDQQTTNRDSIAMLIFATELERPAGERMVYSDIGAFVLGRVIERVSSLSLDQYMRANLARPLKLKDTRFNPPASMRKRIAPTEIDSLRGGLVRGAVHDERAYYLGGVAAHAGLFSSAADLSRFATMMLRGGALDGTRILTPATIAMFTAYADSTFSNRALGWQKAERPEMPYRTSSAWAGQFMSPRAFGHTGFTGTSIAIDPELDLYVILLSNRVNPTRSNNKIGAVRSRLADAIVPVVRHHRANTSNARTR